MAWSRTSEWPFCALLLVLLACACDVAAQGGSNAGARIGYVDMKRLLDSAPQMSAARRQLESEFATRDAALVADEKRLGDRRAALDRDAATLPATQADAQKRELETLDRAIRRSRDNLRNELKTRSDQVLDGSWREINNVVVEFARERGYDLIVQSPVIYANPRVDVTEAVLERLRTLQQKAGGQ